MRRIPIAIAGSKMKVPMFKDQSELELQEISGWQLGENRDISPTTAKD